MKYPLYVTILFISLLLIGCSDNGLSPELKGLFGTYEITRVNGKTTPFIISQNDSCTTINIGGWLTLSEDMKYEMETDVVSEICQEGNKSTFKRLNYGSYKFRDDSLFFAPLDSALSAPFKADIRGGDRGRLYIRVYENDLYFERLRVGKIFDEKRKEKMVQEKLKNFLDRGQHFN